MSGGYIKIAVASKGRELSSKIEPRFGRSEYFVIHDTERNSVEIIDNRETAQLSGGAGVKAAEDVVEKRVDYVVSQNFGPNALRVFKAANVQAAVVSDVTVAEAIELAKRRQLNLI